MALGAKWGGFAWGQMEWAFAGASGPIVTASAIGTGVFTGTVVYTQVATITGTGVLTALIPISASIIGTARFQHIVTGLRDGILTQIAAPTAWPQVEMPIAYILNRFDRGVVISGQTSGPLGAIEETN